MSEKENRKTVIFSLVLTGLTIIIAITQTTYNKSRSDAQDKEIIKQVFKIGWSFGALNVSEKVKSGGTIDLEFYDSNRKTN